MSRSPLRIGSDAGPTKKAPARGLTIAAAVLALLATLGLVPPPAAADDGRAPATPRKVVKGDPYRLVGAKVAAQLKAAQSINQHATGPKRKVLDYKLARKYDKGHATVRRQFAASWLWTGKSIKNISKKERKIVRSYVNKYFGSRRPSPDLVEVGSDAYPQCQGRSGHESFGNGNWNIYLSSCQTSAIMRSLRYGGLAAGLIATKMGPGAPIGVVTAFLMEASAEWIDAVRDLSSIDAVYVMRRLIGPSRARLQVLTLMPQ